MGVDIPNSYTVTLAPQPLQTGVTVSGVGLNDIHIKEIPHITLDPVTLNANIAVTEIPHITLDPVTLNANIAITEIPSLRVHMPARFDFGISLLGLEVLTFSLCGEAMIITEPYVPNECEICGRPRRLPEPQPDEPTPGTPGVRAGPTLVREG